MSITFKAGDKIFSRFKEGTVSKVRVSKGTIMVTIMWVEKDNSQYTYAYYASSLEEDIKKGFLHHVPHIGKVMRRVLNEL